MFFVTLRNKKNYPLSRSTPSDKSAGLVYENIEKTWFAYKLFHASRAAVIWKLDATKIRFNNNINNIFRIKLTELTSFHSIILEPWRLLTFFVPNAAIIQGRRLIGGGAYSAKYSRPFAARLLRGTKPPCCRAREALRQEKQTAHILSLIHIWRCRRSTLCRSRWSPYH